MKQHLIFSSFLLLFVLLAFLFTSNPTPSAAALSFGSTSISGRVTDANGASIEGVAIVTGEIYSATTDSNGEYMISELMEGEYTIRLSKKGYAFAPASRMVSVASQDVSGVDFVGMLTADFTLVERFAPLIYLHDEEIYTPMDIQLALEHSTLSDDEGNVETNVTTEVLVSEQWFGQEDAYLDFMGTGAEEVEAYYESEINASVEPTVYVRLVRDDPANQIAIQYWLFYYDNPWLFYIGGIPWAWLSHHEGDWEMVQVLLDSEEMPMSAAYSQHHSGSKRLWVDVKKEGEHPLVYPAKGSHASYFAPYTYFQAGTDEADAPRSTPITPTISLLPISDNTWTYFHGHWGSEGTISLFEQDGPSSPGHQAQKWENPFAWANDDIPWDEHAIHTLGKIKTTVYAPNGVLDVFAYECEWPQPLCGTQKVTGWDDGQLKLEIPSGEHFNNPHTSFRTILIHQPEQPLYHYGLGWTLRSSPSSDATPADPVIMTIQYPNLDTITVTEAIYMLEGSLATGATGVVSLGATERMMQIDVDGDGKFDQEVLPSSTEVIDITPSGASVLYLPTVIR